MKLTSLLTSLTFAFCLHPVAAQDASSETDMDLAPPVVKRHIEIKAFDLNEDGELVPMNPQALEGLKELDGLDDILAQLQDGDVDVEEFIGGLDLGKKAEDSIKLMMNREPGQEADLEIPQVIAIDRHGNEVPMAKMEADFKKDLGIDLQKLMQGIEKDLIKDGAL